MLASDGLIERVSESTNSFVVRCSDQELSGQAICFSSEMNTGIVKAKVKLSQPPSPIEVMKFQGKCELEFSGSLLPGIVVSVTSNFDDSTFEISFMPDGDT